jgi:non-canonical poly(A) RNA polymerase PAPD5/7
MSKWEQEDFISLSFDEDKAPTRSAVPDVPAGGPVYSNGGPWTPAQAYRGPTALMRLHEEILDFCRFVSPTSDEEAARMDLVARLRALVLSLWPHAEVKVFGSMTTKLYLPTRCACGLV